MRDKVKYGLWGMGIIIILTFFTLSVLAGQGYPIDNPKVLYITIPGLVISLVLTVGLPAWIVKIQRKRANKSSK